MKNKNKFNRLLIALPTLLLLATTGVHAGNDAHSGKTTRVSVSSKGAQGDSPSSSNAISAGGRYVAFTSDATNLVAGDTNGVSDAFVRDRKTGKTTRISVSSEGKQANSPGLFGSSSRAISADGRYVAFISYATNLVTGDTNGVPDVFVRDRKTGKTTRVSSAGEQPQCSSDNAVISADGRYVAFRCGIAGTWVYLHDRKTGETTYISGDDVNLGAISADGRYVTYGAFGLCLKLPGAHLDSIGRAGVYDRVTGMKTTVSGGSCGSHSYPRAISAGGRYVAVQSDADNLVAGDTNNANDAFVHDRKTGETTRVSVSSASAEGERWQLSHRDQHQRALRGV